MAEKKKKLKIEHWHIITMLLMVYDCFAVAVSYLLALVFRFELNIEKVLREGYLKPYVYFVPIYIILSIIIFCFCRMYKTVWRFVSVSDVLYATLGSLISSFVHSIGITLMVKYIMHSVIGRMPYTYYAFGAVLQLFFVVGGRCAYRILIYLRDKLKKSESADNKHRIMIIGAGEAGRLLVRDIASPNNKRLKVVCIIDDNRNKWGRYLDGIKIIGGRNSILEGVEKHNVDMIYIAMPSAPKTEIAEIVNICSNTNCEVKKLPSFFKSINDSISVKDLRSVSVEDLLGREPVSSDMHEIYDFIKGKKVLVTGGGGSIGSELCRQIAGHKPESLIIFDIYENNAYDIQNELIDKYPYLDLHVIIGSVRDALRLKDVFETYKPDVVYHAAAHKHVPLMEVSPNEAIKNNVFGTYLTAYTAMVYGVSRFVMISTDKAVNPTNIMGASKRMCEMVVQSFDRMIKEGRASEIPFPTENPYSDIDFSSCHTEFVAVRFGNVLGSNGSVVPLFLKQIAAGGPVTVTHPDIIRYFMTIPEAVSLVLLAGTYAGGGEIFVLDMGEPVKIDTLARNLIKLSGHKPDVDIKVVYTGLRPGEKLYEEKLMAEEGLAKSPNDQIHIGAPIKLDENQFFSQLDSIFKAAFNNSSDIEKYVEKIVPTFNRNN